MNNSFILFCLFLLLGSKMSSQKMGYDSFILACDSFKTSNIIVEKNYEGVVLELSEKEMTRLFLKNYKKETWKPSNLDIAKFEMSMESYIDSLCLYKFSTLNTNLKIDKRKYLRQYLGLYDKKGAKVIFVSFNYFNSKDDFCKLHRENFFTSFNLVCDGYYKYFTVKYRLPEIFDLKLNF